MDTEAKQIMDGLPTQESAHDSNYKLGSGYFRIPAPNAWVCIGSDGRLEIWPTEAGGWLGVLPENVMGDIAPFCD